MKVKLVSYSTPTEEFLNEGIDKTVQSGIYFNNKGIFSMKGCRVRHHLVPSYADIRDKKII